jgi:hypothetical protein
MEFWYSFDEKGIGSVSLDDFIINIRRIVPLTNEMKPFVLDDSKIQLEHRLWDWFAVIERSLFILTDYRLRDCGLYDLSFFKNDFDGQKLLTDLGAIKVHESTFVIAHIKKLKKEVKESIDEIRIGLYKDYAVKANLLFNFKSRPSTFAKRVFVQSSQNADIVNLNMEYMVRHISYQACYRKSNNLSVFTHPASIFEAVKIMAGNWGKLNDSFEISAFLQRKTFGNLNQVATISNDTADTNYKNKLFLSTRDAKMIGKRQLREFTSDQIQLHNDNDLFDQQETTYAELVEYDPSFSVGITAIARNRFSAKNLREINSKLAATSTTALTTVANVEASPSHNGMNLFYSIVVATKLNETIREVFQNRLISTTSDAREAANIAENAANSIPYNPKELYKTAAALQNRVITFMEQHKHTASFVELAARLFNTTMTEQIDNLKNYPKADYQCVPFTVKVIACMLEIDIKLVTADCVFMCISDKLLCNRSLLLPLAEWHQPAKAAIAFDGKIFHSIIILSRDAENDYTVFKNRSTYTEPVETWSKFIRV